MKLFLSLVPRALLLGALLLFLWQPHLFEPLFRPLVNEGVPVIYERASFVTLTLQHLGLVALAALASTIVAVLMAILLPESRARSFCRSHAVL